MRSICLLVYWSTGDAVYITLTPPLDSPNRFLVRLVLDARGHDAAVAYVEVVVDGYDGICGGSADIRCGFGHSGVLDRGA